MGFQNIVRRSLFEVIIEVFSCLFFTPFSATVQAEALVALVDLIVGVRMFVLSMPLSRR